MKIVTIEEITNRIEEKFPNEPFEIVEYTRVSKSFAIRCLKCGNTYHYSSFNNYFNAKRKGICPCYNSKNNITKHKNTLEQIQKRVQNNPEIEFIEYWHNSDTQKNMVCVKCLKCEQIYSKPLSEFLKNDKCPFCIGRESLNTQAVKALLPAEYELLDEYKSTNQKVHVRHKCGFIWAVKVKTLYNSVGCPHCNKKESKGEQKITQWLLNNGYDFYTEYSFKWQSNVRRRYDFYIPDFNLIIEYMGEQHYHKNSYFKLPLEEQQKIDKEKELEAEQQHMNYLIIGYFDYSNIDTILTNWFNDYPEKE